MLSGSDIRCNPHEQLSPVMFIGSAIQALAFIFAGKVQAFQADCASLVKSVFFLQSNEIGFGDSAGNTGQKWVKYIAGPYRSPRAWSKSRHLRMHTWLIMTWHGRPWALAVDTGAILPSYPMKVTSQGSLVSTIPWRRLCYGFLPSLCESLEVMKAALWPCPHLANSAVDRSGQNIRVILEGGCWVCFGPICKLGFT
jgi:hypothetical protein